MYFANAPHIIEANDIEALRYAKVERLPDGSVVVRLALQLKPGKDYVDAPSLHITDGISHRLLDPTPAQTVTEEEVTPSTPKGKKAAKQEESTNDAN